MERPHLEQLSDVLWEIPKTYRDDMRVPARIYASERMLESIIKDRRESDASTAGIEYTNGEAGA